jgi:hypothetical protein
MESKRKEHEAPGVLKLCRIYSRCISRCHSVMELAVKFSAFVSVVVWCCLVLVLSIFGMLVRGSLLLSCSRVN